MIHENGIPGSRSADVTPGSSPGNAPGSNERLYFLPYQQAWLRDKARLRICQKSRQIGLSYADSYDSVCKAAVPPGRDVWVMSRDEAQAKQYVLYCKRWARVLQLAAADHGQQVFTPDAKAVQAQAIRFASGKSIYALSSNPDAIVGKTGHVKLDEFALHKDQRTLYAVAKPVIQWGGTLSIISTHRGAHTVFNEIITDVLQHGNPMGWSLHSIPIQRAVEEGLAGRIDRIGGGEWTRRWNEVPLASRPSTLGAFWLGQQRTECIDEEQWLQEYCCVPADDSAAFIAYELINACTEADCLRPFEHLESCPNPLYLGVDVARRRDLCVLDVGERIGDVVWDRMRIELLDRPFSEIEEELYRLLALPQLVRACIDATGLGAQLAERAREQCESKVEPIVFTAPIKEQLALGLKLDLESRQLRLADDPQLRADLRGIRKEVTPSGNTRFAGESGDSHCDRFWAKALRQEAARRKETAGAWVG